LVGECTLAVSRERSAVGVVRKVKERIMLRAIGCLVVIVVVVALAMVFGLIDMIF
jgi:hypothetical protein